MARRDEIETQAVDRATSDPAFRARLLAEPHDTLAELAGAAIPDELTIRVEEEQPGEIVLVLPPAVSDGAVSDAELAGTAGGWVMMHHSNQCTDGLGCS